ncbi:MAG: hypothetical protein DRR19_02730 [Candidatus Parabeggiatoa sp. nov. 1]|nr:MAG: hypothetical protein DRR19_02730 [Gammaproteobacteria bacterium]HEC86089.1 hypothetical protein [Thioploca sp.]
MKLKPLFDTLLQHHPAHSVSLFFDKSDVNAATRVYYSLEPLGITSAGCSAIVSLVHRLYNHPCELPGTNPKNASGLYTTKPLSLLTTMETGILQLYKIKINHNPSQINPRNRLAFTSISSALIDFYYLYASKPPHSLPLSDPQLILNDPTHLKFLGPLYLLAALGLVVERSFGNRGHQAHGKNVGAILTSRSGKVLSWGLNTKHSNSCYHAEVNALLAQVNPYTCPDPTLLHGAHLFTTHQPCTMCSGLINTIGNGKIFVCYGLPDHTVHHSFIPHSHQQQLQIPGFLPTQFGPLNGSSE